MANRQRRWEFYFVTARVGFNPIVRLWEVLELGNCKLGCIQLEMAVAGPMKSS